MKKLFALLVAIAAVVVLSGNTQAALEMRGLGTIVSGGSGNYQLIYDTELGITWLDYTRDSDTWYNQVTWAEGLEVSFNEQSYGNWRLPQTLPVNGSTYTYDSRYDGSSDLGYNISAPGTIYEGSTWSEMAHLFYNSLGNLGYYPIDYPISPAPQPGWGLEETGPFNNLQGDVYWSGTLYPPFPDDAWGFHFNGGHQGLVVTEDYRRALAVLPGDVSAVPIPGAVWLFGSGLVGLAGLRRKFKKN